MSRRMLLFFLLVLSLVTWQALATPPFRPPAFHSVWRSGEQVLPIAVPAWDAVRLPEGLGRRRDLLRERAVAADAVAGWPSSSGNCDLFLRISAHHWLRRQVSSERLADLLGRGGPVGGSHTGHALLGTLPRDVLDDDDGDGDPLDPGEIGPTGSGIEVELFCS